MSKRLTLALDLARYGLYLLLFISVATGWSALPAGRLFLLAVLLLTLTILGYLCTERARSERARLGLLVGELVVLVAIGFTVRYSWFPLLYLVFVAEAIFSLPRKWTLPVILAAYGGLGATLYFLEAPVRPGDFVVTMVIWLAGFAFVAASSLLILEQETTRERSDQLARELRAAHEQLDAYAGEVERLSATRDHQRLAQEVHDSVAQVLTGLLVQLQALRQLLQTNPTMAAARLTSMEEAARHGLDEVRRAVRAMRPEQLAGVEGVEAMRQLCHQFSRRTRIRVFFTTEGNTFQLPPAREALIYRVLQECLTNAARHGRASAVWAHLQAGEGRIELRVRDDGVGAARVTPGMGIGGLQERAQATGGRFSYRTRPGQGFETVLELPLAAPSAIAR